MLCPRCKQQTHCGMTFDGRFTCIECLTKEEDAAWEAQKQANIRAMYAKYAPATLEYYDQDGA